QPAPGTGIAEVERPGRRGEAANANAANRPRAVAVAGDGRAERAHGLGSVDHVLALEQSGNPRLAHGQGADDQGAMRDRFVARDTDAAQEGLATAGRYG